MGDDDVFAMFIAAFAAAMRAVDSRGPIALRAGGKGAFQPGIGPHAEDQVVRLCLSELAQARPELYAAHGVGVSYPEAPRSRCDLCLGSSPDWGWAIELKLLRFLGDNGKPNGNMLMHILSPYAQDRSALTDCDKLVVGGLGDRRAIVIFGYDHHSWPLLPAIEAFECLARQRVRLGPRRMSDTGALMHPVHAAGQVFGWEVFPRLR